MLRRRTYKLLIITAQGLTLAGLGLALGWNITALLSGLPPPALWQCLLLALPGGLFRLGLLALSRLAAYQSKARESYRLVYDTPQVWNDARVRQALTSLAHIGADLVITWAREGEGVGCWLSVSQGYGHVLQRLVEEVFPDGQLEANPPPQPGPGIVLLRWQKRLPPPLDLIYKQGIVGLYYHYRSPETATLTLWGPQADIVAGRFAQAKDLLPGEGPALQTPLFVGDNPWPRMPPFPASPGNAGLAATSSLKRLAPALRVEGPALILGHDPSGGPAGFALPELNGLRRMQVFGQAAESVAVTLAYQAMRAGISVAFFDGQGGAVAQLGRRLSRQVALGQVLICDVERPAQSHFRLNPLWLPEQSTVWPEIFAHPWKSWLRELGVTVAGLGQASYRHTLVSVILTSLAAAGQGLRLDVPTLRRTLERPDFLALLDETVLPEGAMMLGRDSWQWWLAEGHSIPNFDIQLRLSHLRGRLDTLLGLPEYDVLWSPTYLDPGLMATEGKSLLWRLPDPKRRLGAYITSQFLAITSLLRVWPRTRPLLIVTHELDRGEWTKYFNGNGVFVVEAHRRLTALARPSTLVISRLHREDARRVQPMFEGIQASDLCRLPDKRLLLRRDGQIGTLDMAEV